MSGIFKWLWRWFVRLSLLGVVLLVALYSWLDFERRSQLTLPAPTGEFAVGRSSFAWKDETRPDAFAQSPEIKRELVVWFWYPAEATASASPAEYLPAPWRIEDERAAGPVLRLLSRDLTKVHTHSFSDVPLSAKQRSYPVVVMLPGSGAQPTDYTTVAEGLTDHGYVVIGLAAPYLTRITVFPDGRVVKRRPENDPEVAAEPEHVAERLVRGWGEDIGWVLDKLPQIDASSPEGRFAGRLDLKSVGVFGHSLGGSSAAEFCHLDGRCKAGIDIDGMPLGTVVREGLHVPFMLLLSDHSKENDAEAAKVKTDLDTLYRGMPPDSRQMLVIRGANHFSFSDLSVLRSPMLFRILHLTGVIGRLGERQGLEIAADCVHTFFDIHLGGAPATRIDELVKRHPEIQPTIALYIRRP